MAGTAVVRDIGTRFLVTRDGSVSVGVRDGRVQVTQQGTAHEATPGEHLFVSTAGAVTRSYRQPYGREWDWIVQAAPPPAIDGRTLEEFLTWVEREGDAPSSSPTPRSGSHRVTPWCTGQSMAFRLRTPCASCCRRAVSGIARPTV